MKRCLMLGISLTGAAIIALAFSPNSRAALGDTVKWIYSAGPAKDYYGGITWVEGTWGGTYYNCLGEQVSKTATIEFIDVQSAPNGSEGNNYVLHSVSDNGVKDMGVAWDKDNQCWFITDPWGYCGSTGMKIPKNGGSADFVWYCHGNPVGITYDAIAQELLVTSNYLEYIAKWTYDGTGYPTGAGALTINFQSNGIERVGDYYWISYTGTCYVHQINMTTGNMTGNSFCIPEGREAWELAFDGQYLWVRSNYLYGRLKLYQIDIEYQPPTPPPTATPTPSPSPSPTSTPSPTAAHPHLVLASGDYNGDGSSEIGIFRESSGLWAIKGLTQIYFGQENDLPVSGDYNGDGTTSPGIYRASAGLWAVKDLTRVYFGGGEDMPVPGDYNGDGNCGIGIFRESSGLWAIRDLTRVYMGNEGDLPIPGPWQGGWLPTVMAIFRPSTSLWYLKDIKSFYFGNSGDLPVPSSYETGSSWRAAVYRPSAGLWALRALTRIYYGGPADWPVPADYQGDMSNDLAIFRESSGLWSIQGVTRVYYGAEDDIPVSR